MLGTQPAQAGLPARPTGRRTTEWLCSLPPYITSEMNSHTSGCIRRVVVQQHPTVGRHRHLARRAGAPAHSRPAPPGWLAFDTCASCCGSPSRITFVAEIVAANVSARPSWPASSTTSTSTGLLAHRPAGEQPRRPGDHVEVTARAPGVVVDVPHAASDPSFALRTARNLPESPSSLNRSTVACIRLSIAAWLIAVTPTRLPAVHQCADQLRTGVRLAGARRTLDRTRAPVESGRPPAHRRHVGGELAVDGPPPAGTPGRRGAASACPTRSARRPASRRPAPRAPAASAPP